ncbi:MAG: RHS repeat protein, partial [Nitrospirae bacterium]|nr:RHS repeat protein [Nitrospirota bacterium]
FLQDNIFKGRVDFTEVRNGPNPLNLFSRVVNFWDYTSHYSGVLFPFLLKEDRYVHDGSDSPQRTETLYEYDPYGNIKKVDSRGDLSKTGDERVDGVDFIYNDTADFYIVSHPSRKFTTDDFGTLLTQTWFGYDVAVLDPANPSAGGVSPTRGDVTSIVDWFPEGANPMTTFGYDVYGNQIKITDARGNSSKTVFDSLFHSVPIIMTNAKEQSVLKKYYGIDVPVSPDGPIPGLLASVTDINQITVSYKYDALGRVTQEIIPPDTAATPTVQYSYERDGIPPESTLMKKRDTSPNGGGTLESATFTDGFGRVIQSKRESHDPATQITVDQTYNNRGQVESSSIPYLVQGPLIYSSPLSQPKTTTSYDPVGRVTTITNPDGSYATLTPLQWSTTIINSNGQKRVESMMHMDS